LLWLIKSPPRPGRVRIHRQCVAIVACDRDCAVHRQSLAPSTCTWIHYIRSLHRMAFEGQCGAAGAVTCGPSERPMPPQPACLSSAGPSQMHETPISMPLETTASVFFQPLPLQPDKQFNPDDAVGTSAGNAPALQSEVLKHGRSLSPKATPKTSQKNSSKADRVREKNRLAQARFRQKQRV
jgi:hypothetical protein